MLSGGYTTPIQGRIGERPHVGSVNFMVGGCVSDRSEDREIQLNPWRPLFFSPGAGYDYTVDGHFNGVVFQLDLKRIRRTAAAMAGLGVSPRRFRHDLERVRVLAPHDPRTPISLSQLEERSGYSRRHIQLSFQQRFGCWPIQWIRQQRLEQAHQSLLPSASAAFRCSAVNSATVSAFGPAICCGRGSAGSDGPTHLG